MYRWLKLVAEVDRDELWSGDGLASCAHWLDWKCGINIATAREKVRVARALDSLPRISEAFRKGEVSYSKVRAMSRVANAQTEEYWVTLARSATASQIETVVRKYRQVERAQEGEETEQQHDRRSLEYYWDENRSLVIRDRLPTEEGAIVLKALEAGAGRPWEADREAASNDQEDVSAETSHVPEQKTSISVSYTHLTLPTTCSV